MALFQSHGLSTDSLAARAARFDNSTGKKVMIGITISSPSRRRDCALLRNAGEAIRLRRTRFSKVQSKIIASTTRKAKCSYALFPPKI